MLFYMALCHTIICEKNENEEISYNASSPDELALINFAKLFGVEYLGIDENNYMKILYEDNIQKFELLHVLDFDSTRLFFIIQYY